MNTRSSIQLIQQHLNKCFEFLSPFHSMINDSLVYFLKNDLWNKYIPSEIREEISSANDAETAMNIYWNHLEPGQPEVNETNFVNFRKFLASAREHSIENMNDIWIPVEDLKRVLNCENSVQLKVHGNMSEKKNHEVN